MLSFNLRSAKIPFASCSAKISYRENFSAQCIYELLSILTFVRIHLGFRKIFLWLMPVGIWWLVATGSIVQSMEWTIKGQAMTLRRNVYQNRIRQPSPALWEKTGPIRLWLVGLTAGCKAGRWKSCGTGFSLKFDNMTCLLSGLVHSSYWFWHPELWSWVFIDLQYKLIITLSP